MYPQASDDASVNSSIFFGNDEDDDSSLFTTDSLQLVLARKLQPGFSFFMDAIIVSLPTKAEAEDEFDSARCGESDWEMSNSSADDEAEAESSDRTLTDITNSATTKTCMTTRILQHVAEAWRSVGSTPSRSHNSRVTTASLSNRGDGRGHHPPPN